jgi:hypothetical protein
MLLVLLFSNATMTAAVPAMWDLMVLNVINVSLNCMISQTALIVAVMYWVRYLMHALMIMGNVIVVNIPPAEPVKPVSMVRLIFIRLILMDVSRVTALVNQPHVCQPLVTSPHPSLVSSSLHQVSMDGLSMMGWLFLINHLYRLSMMEDYVLSPAVDWLT